MGSSNDFYDGMANVYHLIYGDWNAGISNQSQHIHTIIQENWDDAKTILDVSCGIGTQTLGLAQLGYTLTASDLSPKEIDRAKREAQARDLVIDFSVADMRHAFDHHQKQADVLISVDNAVPHLLHDEEILQAFRQFYQCVRVGGGCLITVRDYEKEDLSGIQYKPHGVRYLDGMKTVIWQVWEFDNDIYDVTMYFVHDEGSSEGMVQIFRGKYYAIGVTKLMALMREAGFGNVRRLDGVFYQPVIVGTKLGARVE